MKGKAALILAIMSGIPCCGAYAKGNDGRPTRPDDHAAEQASYIEALQGNPEQQERFAALYLDPRARVTRAKRIEGARFLLKAAASGRREAMLRLADALDSGAHGYAKSPAAARCWSAPPAGFEQRLACLRLTDFRDRASRVPCWDLVGMTIDLPPARRGAATDVRICLANKTPTLLVPGGPPGKEDRERNRLYAKHGISLTITGDVYDESYEKYRYDYNTAAVAAIEAERGKGYMKKLGTQIEADLAQWRERAK